MHHYTMCAQMRRIKKLFPQFISLVPKGMNQLPVIYKEDGGQGSFEASLLTKACDRFEELGEIIGCVYAPEHRDKEGDIASGEVIKEAVYNAAREGGAKIDMRHNGVVLPKEKAFVAQSFIIQKGDPRYADMKDSSGKPVDVTDGWGVVIKIDDPELRTQYRKGKWQGLSMQGPAVLELNKEAPTVQGFMAELLKAMGVSKPSTNGDITMDPTAMQAMLTKSNDELATKIVTGITAALTTALAPVIKKEEPKTETKPGEVTAPVFKGDPMSIKDVQAHQLALTNFNLQKSVKWDDPVSVAQYQKELTEKTAELKGEKIEKSQREVELLAELETLRKSSNQGAGGNGNQGEKQNGVQCEGLSKEDKACADIGLAMGQFSNQRRGFKTA